MTYIIGITGGSGSGKSTLAYGLKDKFPDLIEIVHFDDYQKDKEEVPVHHGMSNWDHPDAINFEKLLKDLNLIKSGKNVEIMTKSEKYNPKYEKIGRIKHIMKSKKIIIVEGYMALQNKKVRDLYSFTIFLDLNENERMRRRTKFLNPRYNEKILFPMNKEHVESTKKFAKMIVHVEKYNNKEVLNLIIKQLKIEKVL